MPFDNNIPLMIYNIRQQHITNNIQNQSTIAEGVIETTIYR